MGGREDPNIYAARFEERVARQPERVRRALDEMDDDLWALQLRVLRRSRAYPEPGDTFRLEPPLCPPLEGVVVNSRVTNMSTKNLVVVLIFAPGVSPATALSMGVPPESLMVPPQMLTDLYWRRGYFERTGHVEVDRATIGYGFYSPGSRRFQDEYRNALPAEPRLLGLGGIATDIGVAAKIARESLFRGLSPWPPPGWEPPPPPPPATSEGPAVLLDACHPDALALAEAAARVDPACLLNGYGWEAALPAVLARAGRAGLLEGLSTDPEAGALAARYRGRGAAARARELAGLLSSLVASRDEVLGLVASGEVDWEG